jgi:hypothetical protein
MRAPSDRPQQAAFSASSTESKEFRKKTIEILLEIFSAQLIRANDL